MKFITSHVSFIVNSNSENCIKICWFFRKLETKISWLRFYGSRCSISFGHNSRIGLVMVKMKSRWKINIIRLNGGRCGKKMHTRWKTHDWTRKRSLEVALTTLAQCFFSVQLQFYFLWPPILMGRPLYFCPVVSSSSIFFCLFFSPNLSGRRLDVYHTST